MVGSREADDDRLAFARMVGSRCARSGIQVISGGARGVDAEAMIACMSAGGCATGVLAEGLARSISSGRFADWVERRSLALVSPFHPDARFQVGTAMARNKLVYALADLAVVVSSDYMSGGTWAGAVENLEHRWAPLFVCTGEGVPEGNLHLAEAGAIPVYDGVASDGDLVKWMVRTAESASANVGAQGTLPLF